MSNGEKNLADSWEEIDDDKLTNQLNKIKKEVEELQNQKKFEDDRMPLQNGNIPAIMLAMRPDDGNYSASKPAVKILRRPTQSSDSRNLNNDKPKQPIKTLQQREQEYAEARLRILGSAKNPEDELDAALDKLLTTKITPQIPPILNTTANNSVNQFSSTKTNSNLAQQQLLLSSLTYHSPDHGLQQQRQRQLPLIFAPNRETFATSSANNFIHTMNSELIGGGLGVGGGTGEYTFNNHVGVASAANQENILRMPRGPDNTGGFNMQR